MKKDSIIRGLSGIVLALLILTLSSHAFGQGRVSRYTASTFSGTLQSISGTGSYLGSDDDGSYNFICPFAFVYDSVTIAASSTWDVGDNGMIGIGSTIGDPCCNGWIGSSSYPNQACLYSTDLYHYAGGNYYQVTGTSPNRVLTVELYEDAGYGEGTSNATTMQAKFYETTNVIEFWYANYNWTLTATDNSSSYSIGLNGNTTGQGGFKYLLYQGNISGGSSSTLQTPAANVRFTPPVNISPAELALLPQPKSLNFGSLPTGQADTLSVTIKNVGGVVNGGTNLTFASGIYITGVPDFSIISALPVSLAPGASTTIQIRFAPIANGGRGATLNVLSNGADSGQQTVSLSGFGLAPAASIPPAIFFNRQSVELRNCATQSIVITSNGQGPLTMGFTIGGLDASAYSISRYPQNPLPQGTSDTLTVSFCPNAETLEFGNLIITTNAANLPRDTINMFGIGILPRLQVSPTPLNFDSVAIGGSVTDSIMITNPGSDTIFVKKNYFTSADGDYTLTPLTGNDTIIPPDITKYVKVTFTPRQNGSRVATYRILTNIPLTFDATPRDTSEFDVNIIGEAVPYGLLAVEGPPILDSEIVGQTICSIDTLSNNGSAPLTVNSYTVTGTDSLQFKITGIPLPLTIQPGGRYTFNVCSTPASRGLQNASLNVNALTSNHPTDANLSLGVFGQEACESVGSQNTGFPALTCVGSSDTAYITVTNCGDVTSIYSATLSSSATGYAILGAKISASTAPTGTTKYGIVFTPDTTGKATGTVTITGTGGVVETVNLDGTGGAAASSGTGEAITQIGKTDTINATVTNAGLCDWAPGTSPVFTGATDFGFVTADATTIIGAGKTGVIRFTYSPTVAGTDNATVTFPNESEASFPAATVTLNGTATTTSVERLTSIDGYSLDQNYPNPFNPTTEIRFTLPKASHVSIDIMDITGRVVRNVMNQEMSAGSHGTVVNASDLSSGVYYYTLTSGSIKLSRQMILTR